MAEFAEQIDDSTDVTDEALLAIDMLRGVDDAIDLMDGAAIASVLGVVLLDELLLDDELIVSFASGITIDDAVSVTDELTRLSLTVGTFADSIVATDSLTAELNAAPQLNDTVVVIDALVVATTIAFKIDSVTALTESRVRIAFESGALVNAALTNPGSYVFDNLSPGSVEVVPLAVSLPAGQPNPMYVDLDTTEHTNAASYEVALIEGIRGALGQVGHTTPVGYTGIGIKPQLQLVLAISANEVEVHFTEAIANNAAANDRNNYTWAGGISTIAVKSVVGNVVTLQTTAHVPGRLYTLTVRGPIPTVSYEVELDLDENDAEDEVIVAFFGDYTFTIDEEIDVTDSVSVSKASTASATDSIAVTDSIVATLTSAPVLRAIHAGFKGLVDAFGQRIEVQGTVNAGTSWTRLYFPSTSKVVRNGARNVATGTIILVGDDGLFLRSPDNGLSWVSSTPFGVTADITACWYGNGVWIVNYFDGVSVANVRRSTDDGLTWSAGINPDNGTGTGPTGTAPAGASDLWNDGVYAAALGLHVGVGYKGAIWTSPDGLTWTRRTAAGAYVGSFYGFRGVAWSQSQNLLVAVGDAAECQTSPDGINWTKRSFSATNPFTLPWDVSFSPTLGLWCVVGGGASGSCRIQTSPDGINWTSRTPPASKSDMYCCSWDALNNVFIASGRFVYVIRSADGINWVDVNTLNNSGGGTYTNNSASSAFTIIGGGVGQ